MQATLRLVLTLFLGLWIGLMPATQAAAGLCVHASMAPEQHAHAAMTAGDAMAGAMSAHMDMSADAGTHAHHHMAQPDEARPAHASCHCGFACAMAACAGSALPSQSLARFTFDGADTFTPSANAGAVLQAHRFSLIRPPSLS